MISKKLAKWIAYHPKTVLIFCLILRIPSIIGYFLTGVNYDILSYLPENLESVQGEQILDETFHNSASSFIIVKDTEPKDIQKLEEQIRQVEGVTNVLSLNSFIGTAIPNAMLPDSIKEICVQDGKQLMMLNSSYSAATDEENAQIDKITSIVKKYDEGGILTGEGVLTKDLISVAEKDFIVTGAISMLAIFILVAIVFKSLTIPLILVASIELAIWVNISISTLTGTTICFIAPTIISCVQLGATVDYAILMTTRFREELQKSGDKLKAIKTAAQESSKSIFQSALVFFSATFGVYCICDIDIVKGVCLMLARGSVISAFVIMVMLPGILTICEGIINKTSVGWRAPRVKKERKSRKAKA